jgi:hypothetical protein
MNRKFVFAKRKEAANLKSPPHGKNMFIKKTEGNILTG